MSEARETEYALLTDAEREALTRVEDYLGCYDESESDTVDEVQFGLTVYGLTLDDVRTLAATVDRVPGMTSAARAVERANWDDAIDAVRFYRQGWQELRGVLASYSDRLDEHVYDEFASWLDHEWSDDGPVDAAVAEPRNPPAQDDDGGAR